MSETSNFYTKVTQPVTNIVTNIIFALCAAASRLLVLGLICVQISLRIPVNVWGLMSPSVRNASPGLERPGCTAAVLQKKGSERRTAVWILQATKFISQYTAYGRSGDRILVGGEIFHTCPDRLWGPPSLPYNGYRVFPGGKERPGRDSDLSPPLVPWL